MITIIDIAREIDAKKKTSKKEKQADAFNWQPIKVEEFTVPRFNPSKLTKPNIKKLSKVLAFIALVSRKRCVGGCTIMPIPTTNKAMLDICGNKMGVSRLIDFMIEIGLIEVEDAEYQYNADQESYNKSRTYRYYYDNEQLIKKYCKENNINKYIIRNDIYDTVGNKKIDNFDKSLVKIGSKLKLVKPEDCSVPEFEKNLLSALYENYPWLKKYQEKADLINDTFYRDIPEMQQKFAPTFTWDKKMQVVRKIGIRCTNTFVSAKKIKDDIEFNGYFKADILREYDLSLEKDVKSSVPRLTLSMNRGQWVEEDVDIYESIFNEYVEIKEKENNEIVCNKFYQVRDSIKALHMRVYFDKEKRIGVNTRRAMMNVWDKDAVENEMKILRKAVVKAEGERLYDSEIFLHESCIYLDVLYDLLESGFFVWQCYDAFYARKDGVTQDEFEVLVAGIVEEKANAYIAMVRCA